MASCNDLLYLGELFWHLQENPHRFWNVLCSEPGGSPQGIQVQGACQEYAGGGQQYKEGGGEVPGGQDERAQAHLGPSLQQRLLWQPRTRLQCLQCLHRPACGVSNTEREKHPVATRSRSYAMKILKILFRSWALHRPHCHSCLSKRHPTDQSRRP